jgi:hypothetical protein
MKKILSVFAVVFLVGCGNIPIDNQIMATRASLTVAQKGALGYVEQPLCGTQEAAGKAICSKPSIIKKIKIADNAAMTAMTAAEEAKDETSLQIAQTAFKALLEITNNILAGK